jgi:hypothetical protein
VEFCLGSARGVTHELASGSTFAFKLRARQDRGKPNQVCRVDLEQAEARLRGTAFTQARVPPVMPHGGGEAPIRRPPLPAATVGLAAPAPADAAAARGDSVTGQLGSLAACPRAASQGWPAPRACQPYWRRAATLHLKTTLMRLDVRAHQ